MPGLPILFRTIDVGFKDPTTIYKCVDNNGKWELQVDAVLKEASLEDIRHFIKDIAVAPHVAIVIPDDLPQIREHLKQMGLRVK